MASPVVGQSTGQKTSQMTYAQVENAWIQAGGNPQAAAMAAAVSDSESGLNPNATRTNPDGTNGVGLWLLPSNGTPPGTNDPVSNARAAIQLSKNGTDWSQWCSTWSDNNCGVNGGSYLGEGANALAALGQKLGPSSYNVIGSQPSGTGTGASSASVSPVTGQTTGTKGHTVILVTILVGILLLVYWWSRRRGQQPEQTVET